MKSASTSLLNFLNSGQNFQMAEVFTLTLVNGQVYNWTSYEYSLVLNGTVYTPMPITRSKIMHETGMQPASLDVAVYDNGSLPVVGNLSLASAARQGFFDGASFTASRVYMPSSRNTSLGSVWIFSGIVGVVDIGATEIKFSIDDPRILLDVQMPRNVYQPPCINTVYDGACGVAKTTFQGNGTVESGNTLTFATNLTQSDGYFALGYVKFTSGANSGLSANIKSYVAGNVTLVMPLETAVSIGDTFTIYAGCDKQLSTCQSKFNNAANFRGCPFIPAPYTCT